MFTGIIQAVGSIATMEDHGGDMRLRISTGKLSLDDVALGDSIAVNGVCLTAVELPGDGFVADVSRETMTLTSLASLKPGSSVNLEKALTLATRLGGHLVSGHVDGLGEVVSRSDDARSVHFVIRAPDELARYIAHKGSITIDGTSLTVNQVNGAEFDLNIVPHTIQETNIGGYQAGTKVNLEVDIIARYLERLVLGDDAAKPGVKSDINEELLRKTGFIA
ncbi:riboflavin synthase [Solemya velum gill symbiont]|uniref:Riboflavin synthase n=2 Tax=Solemya velum gill symbiont TaxID=2340 RepID=A0A0B0H8A6_SOVGS|nr:riboflavin synthase [Solemya velum gill symbiont]KHF25330.1 riboflavin synthase, alpha subunit [Solemya velum gill symbiont]OOY35132.1 riboflavin synthase subunit alpha [Solemya velum gill symbiont]OOY37851.1 riboflavin synthase subunit alpha [Solemya velum gill symbiont]OOY41146.1 riboflavin synthase subunit alpha [Solemya velum gill symbiont]OOY44387.1 riboflavin synthase subunit alpha [Solemya velum gill symbiont]